ncbi:MAG: restriction endonuclease subunit S [Lachnospira sp.]
MKMQRPKVRFKGFTDDWEQRKLGEVVERRIEQRQQSDEYPRLAFASGQGVIPLSERKTNNREQLTKDEFTKKYLVTELDDIVYNPANVKYGAIDRNKYGRGLISPIYVTFTTKEIPGFIERIVTSHNFQQRALRFEEGTVTKRQSVNPEDLITLDVLVTTKKEEQKKIASFFDDLDNLITFHQRKCEQTKKLKKYMLQKMFPKEGQTVPEIRFEGFTDAWEKHKFSDVIEIGSGMDYKHLEEGNVPVYGTGGYMLSVDKALSDDKDAIGIGRKGTIDKPYILRAPFWTVDTLFYCIPKEDYDLDFTSCLFQNVNWKKKDESTGVPSLSKVIINNVETITPIFDEQKKIGNYFQNLDYLITLHQRKCDELQNIKKFMLQNMFI